MSDTLNTNKTELKHFISAIVDKNYSDANKFLKQTVENKLKNIIKETLKEKN